jgi:hypothetical protein
MMATERINGFHVTAEHTAALDVARSGVVEMEVRRRN